MHTHDQLPDLFGALPTTAFRTATRSGLLGHVLLPFAQRPNVFVADDLQATTVTIHKTGTIDIEVAIPATGRRWTASVREASTGRTLVQDAVHYDELATATEQRTALLGDLDRFLGRVVDAPVRIATHEQASLEIAAGARWQRAVPFAKSPGARRLG